MTSEEEEQVRLCSVAGPSSGTTYQAITAGQIRATATLLNTFSARSNKVVMINFDDGRKSQLIYAKPILDKYGFKASFFIICGRVGTEPSSMNWQDIAELKKDGMDIN
jgi:peptidoglycan/xylan/chitin deacetylase (PgdA/CDA1 family)